MNEDPHPLIMAVMVAACCVLGYFLLVVLMSW